MFVLPQSHLPMMCGSSVIKSSMGWVQANREYRLRLGMVVAELLLGTTCTPSTAPSAAGHMQARLVHAHQFHFSGSHHTHTPPRGSLRCPAHSLQPRVHERTSRRCWSHSVVASTVSMAMMTSLLSEDPRTPQEKVWLPGHDDPHPSCHGHSA